MDFEQAERRFRELQSLHKGGELDTATFRVEVAKLLLRDEEGAFWMLDADDGRWYCNRGDGWRADDPHLRPVVHAAHTRRRRRWVGRPVALAMVLVIAVGIVGILAWLRWPPGLWPPVAALPTPPFPLQVTIVSPADGSQVPLGQEIGIEAMLGGGVNLWRAASVELYVDDRLVDSRPLSPDLQPGQASLPLSLPWRPQVAGEHSLRVVVRSIMGRVLGATAITLQATPARSAPPCTPDATFLADVTIPPGTAFAPGARLEKVWQVSNSGTCAWGTGYELVLVEGEQLGAPGAVPAPPCAAGASVDLAVTFWAPVQAGRYVSVWQLQAPDGTFFGPPLTLDIVVEAQARRSRPPAAPTDLRAVLTETGDAVRLTWTDRSDDEDAFRIYRQDVAASIGLAPADAQTFVDGNVACGNTYRYTVVAFNAAGASDMSEMAEITLPPCAPVDALPVITLTVTPTQAAAGEVLTVTFRAGDDQQIAQVHIRGEETGDPILDTGRVFTCREAKCRGSWVITLPRGKDDALTLIATARDATGQESEPVRVRVRILQPDRPTAEPYR